MPVPLKIKDLTNMTYNGSDTYGWTASIYGITSAVELGLYNNGSGSFTDLDTLFADEAVNIVIDFTSSSVNLSAGETITLTHNHGTTDLYLPAYSGTGSIKTWYIDSNGLLYEDEALTTLASPDTDVNNESIATGESPGAPDGDTADSTTVTDTSSTSSENEVVDSANVTDTSNVSSEDEVAEVLSLIEAINDGVENKVEELLNLSEDSDGYHDGYSSELISLIESFDDNVIDEVSELLAIGDITGEGIEDGINEILSLSDSPEPELIVEYSDIIVLVEDANTGALIYRYIDNVGISDSVEEDALVDSVLQGVAVGEVVGVKTRTVEDASYIVVDKFNMSYGGLKLIESVEIGSDKYEGVEVAVMFRYNSDEAWRYTSWIPINKQGVVRVGVAGTEFKLVVRATQGRVVPTYFKVGWKALDKRYVRSAYATSQEN